ncbi:ABC transporter permease [Plebeiibacterium sediminum]|uniref:ABC transporter permease n=1 Tax=Plebeiibacterium sediminum TaxID=2992112 RepID=A0AAE3M3W5_9BACT|nr:ABC transporter permease [Plebeiobacterium sediminum]MCW3786619.1 ABC transporter permease [Plebeiobacterium sediminum]
MTPNNLKIAYRTILKSKTITSLNIIGLSIGIAVSSILFLFTYLEFTKNEDQKNIDTKYVIVDANDGNATSIPIRMLNALKTEIPEISTASCFNEEWSPQVFVKNNDNSYKINKLLVASENFLSTTDLPVVQGNANQSLASANKIVLTESLAKKIFGNVNVIGKTIEYNSTYLQNQILEVGAVIQIPNNSSWNFEAIIPINLNMKIDWYKNLYESWETYNYSAICSINPNADIHKIQEKLANISDDVIPSDIYEGIKYQVYPLKNAYFNIPKFDGMDHGDIYSTYIILIVAILILLLACANFINLNTALRQRNFKNYNIIKSLGSNKNNLISLLITENFLQVFAAIISSVIIFNYLFYFMEKFIDNSISLSSIFSIKVLLILVLLLLTTILITSILPVFSISKTLNRTKNKIQKRTISHSLIIGQFIISIVLISSIIIIFKQNNLILNQDPGFTKDQIIYATTNNDIQNNFQSFKAKLQQIPEISDFTFSSEPFGNITNNWGTTIEINGQEKEFDFAMLKISPNFFNFFNIPLEHGIQLNNLSHQNQDIIINKKAVEKYQITDLLNSRVNIDDNPEHGKIIGQVHNFNMNSFHVPIKSSAFMSCKDIDDIIYLKLNTKSSKQINQLLTKLNNIWTDISPNFPFDYKFLDKSWEALYQKDLMFQKMILFATLMSILLSCLGLISLTSLVLENKTKEIGIRKVNGAKTNEIMLLLNNSFVKWIVIAFLIATPISFFAMQKWLQNFAYKTELSWWVFMLAGLLSLAITLLTVSLQSWRAATRNPVEALRYE